MQYLRTDRTTKAISLRPVQHFLMPKLVGWVQVIDICILLRLMGLMPSYSWRRADVYWRQRQLSFSISVFPARTNKQHKSVFSTFITRNHMHMPYILPTHAPSHVHAYVANVICVAAVRAARQSVRQRM